MKTEDKLAREAAERLLAPESPAFFDDLWEHVERDTRARARRRRRLGIAVVAAAAAVVAAAGVYAAPAIFPSGRGGVAVVDRTYSCRVQDRGAVPAFDLEASVALPPAPSQKLPRRAFLQLTTVVKKLDKQFNLPTIDFPDPKSGLRVDRSVCRPSARHVPLRPAGLAAGETVTPDFVGSFLERCVTARRALVHLHLVQSGGVPTRALLAVRNDDAKNRPIAFVKWSPSKITPYFAASCVSLR